MDNLKQFFSSKSSIYSALFSAVILVLWLAVSYALFNNGIYTDWLPYVYAAAVVVLSAVLLVKWRDMSDPVGITWKRILLIGNIVMLAATAALFTENFVQMAFTVSVLFWMALPGYGFRIIADFSEGDSSFFILQSHLSSFMVLFYLVSMLTNSVGFQALVTVAAAASHASAAYSALN